MYYAIQAQGGKISSNALLLCFRTKQDRGQFLKSRPNYNGLQYTEILRSDLTHKNIQTFKSFATDGVTEDGIVVWSVRLWG